MPRKVQHVVPRNGKWAVRKSGSYRVSRYFNTQSEAVDAARDIARRERTELYIHGSGWSNSRTKLLWKRPISAERIITKLINSDFDHNVVVNCPFDEEYEHILQAILFCLVQFGLNPRIATWDRE